MSICIFLLGTTIPSANAQKGMKWQLSEDVFIERIDEDIWRHVSHKTYQGGGPVPSNGLIVRSGAEALLVDTAFNNEQTGLILDWIGKELKARTIMAVITHHHEDRLGGIHEVHKRGIRTLASAITVRLAKQKGLEPPEEVFDKSIDLNLGNRVVQAIYPGPGHAIDNIVVWIPDRKILFGGCLIKSAQAEDLGNTKDADMKQWPGTVEAVYKQFGQARMVVPGHGDVGGLNALTRTLELLKKAER